MAQSTGQGGLQGPRTRGCGPIALPGRPVACSCQLLQECMNYGGSCPFWGSPPSDWSRQGCKGLAMLAQWGFPLLQGPLFPELSMRLAETLVRLQHGSIHPSAHSNFIAQVLVKKSAGQYTSPSSQLPGRPNESFSLIKKTVYDDTKAWPRQKSFSLAVT